MFFGSSVPSTNKDPSVEWKRNYRILLKKEKNALAEWKLATRNGKSSAEISNLLEKAASCSLNTKMAHERVKKFEKLEELEDRIQYNKDLRSKLLQITNQVKETSNQRSLNESDQINEKFDLFLEISDEYEKICENITGDNNIPVSRDELISQEKNRIMRGSVMDLPSAITNPRPVNGKVSSFQTSANKSFKDCGV